MRRAEQEIHKAIFDHLRWRGVPGVFVWHPFSGGYRKPREAAIYKSLGATAGLPDVMVLYRGQFFGLELKSDDGRLTDIQRNCHERMRTAGAVVATVHGIDSAIMQLEQWQLLRPNTSTQTAGTLRRASPR
jgi:hypothetical protein